MKPICPWCRKKAITHYIRQDNEWHSIGFWCINCNKPVDPVKRAPPVIHKMEIIDFLNAHKKGYDVILADPPWKYADGSATPQGRRVSMHYRTMDMADLSQLPVEDITNKRSILFLWAPPPKTPDAMKVIDAWGFTYITKMTWVKTSQSGNVALGLGNYARATMEDLLIARKNDFPMPKTKFPSTFFALRTDHSRKPERSYEIIENMYPDASRIELFARYVYPGWIGVGNEAEPKPKNVYTSNKKTYMKFETRRIQFQSQKTGDLQ